MFWSINADKDRFPEAQEAFIETRCHCAEGPRGALEGVEGIPASKLGLPSLTPLS